MNIETGSGELRSERLHRLKSEGETHIRDLIPMNPDPDFAVKAIDKLSLAVPGGMIVLGGALENNSLLVAGLITGAVVGYSKVPYESIFRKIRNAKNFIIEAAKFTWEVKGEYKEIFRDCFTAPLTLAQQLRERHKNLVGSTIASPLFLAPPLLGVTAAHLTGNPLDGIGTASAIWFSVGSILAPAVYPVAETSNEPVRKEMAAEDAYEEVVPRLIVAG